MSSASRAHGKFVLSWAYHPRALPLAVPAATVHMAAMRGMEVVVLRPEGFALPERDDGQGARAPRQPAAARCARPPTGTKRSRARTCVYVKEWAYTADYGDEAADAEARRRLDATGA